METKINLHKIEIFKNHLHFFFIKFSLVLKKNNIKKESNKLIVSLDLLWNFSPYLAQTILKKPLIYIYYLLIIK